MSDILFDKIETYESKLPDDAGDRILELLDDDDFAECLTTLFINEFLSVEAFELDGSQSFVVTLRDVSDVHLDRGHGNPNLMFLVNGSRYLQGV